MATRARTSGHSTETVGAACATLWVVALLLLMMFNAGPLWRDETNSINLAQMGTLKELWANLHFDSFPALWILLLRGWSFLGFASTDLGVRALGFLIGLGFLTSLWLCSKWVGDRAPCGSVALLGSLPTFLFCLGSNRAYGMALCLLVVSFAAIWRLLQQFSWPRALLAFFACLLFAHCLYYDAIFLSSMLFGAILVAARRRAWKMLIALVAIGLVCVGSMSIYLPVIRRASVPMRIFQTSSFDLRSLWAKLAEVVAWGGSAALPDRGGIEIWIWIALVFLAGGLGASVLWNSQQPGKLDAPASQDCKDPGQERLDLILFSAATMVCGVGGQVCFLLRLRYPTEWWYYVGILTLSAICLEALLGACLKDWRWLGLVRTGFLAAMMACGASAVWDEAHTRRSNVDLIAAALQKQADPADLIIVQTPWEGITFDRYYHGATRWETLPPIDSHKVHRADLLWQSLNQTNPVAPLLSKAAQTLRSGKAVWVVGYVRAVPSGGPVSALPAPPALPTKWWIAPYMANWGEQLTSHLQAQGASLRRFEIPQPLLINRLENLPVIRFSALSTDNHGAK